MLTFLYKFFFWADEANPFSQSEMFKIVGMLLLCVYFAKCIITNTVTDELILLFSAIVIGNNLSAKIVESKYGVKDQVPADPKSTGNE
jgi:hypothetical protein